VSEFVDEVIAPPPEPVAAKPAPVAKAAPAPTVKKEPLVPQKRPQKDANEDEAVSKKKKTTAGAKGLFFD
jgi:hypothetical protein